MTKLGVAVAALVLVAGLGIATPARAQATADAGHLALTLHGRLSDRAEASERAGWISLNVPLDALARPRLIAPEAEPKSNQPQAAPEAQPAESAAKPAGQQVESPAAPALSFAQLKAFAEFSGRATRAALAVVGAAAERRRLDGLSSRSRASAMLPELRLRAQRNTDQALRLSPVTDDPYRVTQADGAGVILEASATFNLDRLVFANAELVVERLRQRAGTERLKLERRVSDALLALYRARELGCLDSATDEARALQRIAVLQLLTELDLLTAGWFSEHAAGLGRVIWGFPEAVLGACQPPDARKAVAGLDDSE